MRPEIARCPRLDFWPVSHFSTGDRGVKEAWPPGQLVANGSLRFFLILVKGAAQQMLPYKEEVLVGRLRGGCARGDRAPDTSLRGARDAVGRLRLQLRRALFLTHRKGLKVPRKLKLSQHASALKAPAASGPPPLCNPEVCSVNLRPFLTVSQPVVRSPRGCATSAPSPPP